MSKTHLAVLAGSVVVLAAAVSTPTTIAGSVAAGRTIGEVVRLDPRLDHLVPPGAVIEVLADGFRWSEGPVWDRAHDRVLFSDIPNNTVHSWSEDKGLEVFLKPSGYTGSSPFEGQEPGSNGLAFDREGRLLLCQHGDRRVARLKSSSPPPPGASPAAPGASPLAASSFQTLADRFEGRRFNSPNDLVLASDEAIYFTDPPYGRPKTFDDPGRELDWCGVYRLTPDGTVTLVVKDLVAPNGIGLSPDGKTLYVNQSRPEAAFLMAYDVLPDGSVAGGRVLFDMTPLVKTGPGLPDGLKIDQQGHIFATGPGGVLVFTPGGTHLGTIRTGVPTANCGFGDDGSTLYITANDMLCRIRLTTRGLGFSSSTSKPGLDEPR
jgi:gluconolactonase